MFFFSKINKNCINYDYSRKVNLKNYKKLKSTRGETLNLAVINSRIFGEQSNVHQIKVLLVMELLSLQKAFTHFELNKSAKRRKTIFVPQESRVFLAGKFYEYFLYNFSKNSIGLIKNLLAFYNITYREFSTKMVFYEKLYHAKAKQSTTNFKKKATSFNNQQQGIELNAFDLVVRNNFYFYDLNIKIKYLFPLDAFLLNKNSRAKNKISLTDQKLGFYKFKL